MNARKMLGLGVLSAVRSRLQQIQPQGDFSGKNIPDAWPIRSRLGWPSGTDLGTMPSVISVVSGPTRSWLAQLTPRSRYILGQVFPALAEQPQRAKDEPFFGYPGCDPEVVALDDFTTVESRARARLPLKRRVDSLTPPIAGQILNLREAIRQRIEVLRVR